MKSELNFFKPLHQDVLGMYALSTGLRAKEAEVGKQENNE